MLSRTARAASTLFSGLVFLAALAAPAPAQMPETPPGKWWKRPKIAERLKLKPEQQERLDEIFSKHRRSFIDLRADVERRAVDLEELLTKKDSDPARIGPATDALEQAKARLGKARTMMIVDMRSVLSEDQWQKILELREEWRRERMDERRGRFGLPRGPGSRGGGDQRTPGTGPGGQN